MEVKNVVITIAAFIFGPLSGAAISVCVALVEMFTISTTGWLGFIMNAIASLCFVCPAAFFYKKKHTMSGAVLGLVTGSLLMTGAMLLWNYLITPFYMNVSREAIAALLDEPLMGWASPDAYEGIVIDDKDERIVQLVLEGHAVEAMAAQLGMSESGFKKRLGRLMRRAGVTTRPLLMARLYAARAARVD